MVRYLIYHQIVINFMVRSKFAINFNSIYVHIMCRYKIWLLPRQHFEFDVIRSKPLNIGIWDIMFGQLVVISFPDSTQLLIIFIHVCT